MTDCVSCTCNHTCGVFVFCTKKSFSTQAHVCGGSSRLPPGRGVKEEGWGSALTV